MPFSRGVRWQCIKSVVFSFLLSCTFWPQGPNTPSDIQSDLRQVATSPCFAFLVGSGASVAILEEDGSYRRLTDAWHRVMLDALGDGWISWSPDGYHLAVQMGQGVILHERWNIYVFTREGQGLRKLTNNETYAYHGWPDWSPDGSRIAYAAGDFFEDGSGVVHTYLFVMNADGTDQRQITSGWGSHAHPAWSPDGTRIAYTIDDHHDTSNVYVIELATGTVTQLTFDGDSGVARWSPDGKQIVFSTLHEGRKIGDIAVMNADGTGRRLLTNDMFDDGSPDWSPDGSRIAFDSIRSENGSDIDIYAMNVDGSDLRQVTHDGRSGFPRWCPNVGDTNTAHDSFAVDRQTGETTRVSVGMAERE